MSYRQAPSSALTDAIVVIARASTQIAFTDAIVSGVNVRVSLAELPNAGTYYSQGKCKGETFSFTDTLEAVEKGWGSYVPLTTVEMRVGKRKLAPTI